jgi:hypothetical protein
MKQSALQALQHVRTTLAYQLTPEAVSELLEPIQLALHELEQLITPSFVNAEPFHPVQPVLTQTHNAKATAVEALARTSCTTDELVAAIRSLRL